MITYGNPAPSLVAIPEYTPVYSPASVATERPLSNPASHDMLKAIFTKKVPLSILLAAVAGVVVFTLVFVSLFFRWRKLRSPRAERQSPSQNRLSFSLPPHRRTSMSPFNSVSVRTYHSPAPSHIGLTEVPGLWQSPIPQPLNWGNTLSHIDRRPLSPLTLHNRPILPTHTPIAPPQRSLQRQSQFRFGLSRNDAPLTNVLRPLHLSPGPTSSRRTGNFVPTSAELV